MKLIAAIDNSAAASPVLTMSGALAAVLGAEVEALHVTEDPSADDGRTARASTESMGIPYCQITGDPIEQLVKRARQQDVAGIVVGTRKSLKGRRIGHVAIAIANAIDKPVIVVPPEARPPEHLKRVVVAMGTARKGRSLKAAIELAGSVDFELIVVHVDDEDSIPSFSDQVAHETDAYATEFLARYVLGTPHARLELRIGNPVDEILRVVDDAAADLLAIGWPQGGDKERGVVARQLVDRSHVPVLLVALAAEP